MGLFKNNRSDTPDPDSPIRVAAIDLSKRYDLYCSITGGDRLYENMRIVGIRSFENKTQQFGTAILGGYLEIEAHDGQRMMIAHFQLYMICEHGSRPAYKILRTGKTDHEG